MGAQQFPGRTRSAEVNKVTTVKGKGSAPHQPVKPGAGSGARKPDKIVRDGKGQK